MHGLRVLILLCLVPARALAGGGDCTPPGSGPDVIVGDLFGTTKWGTVGGVTGYSIGTDSCNVGDAVLPWFAETNDHPLIAQNVYRLKEGRFEQVGMSWLKHGFGALAGDTCCTCRNPGTTDVLGVGCSDPYCANLNGNQGGFFGVAGLGPRSEVNAATGEYPFPYGSQGMTGDALYKRIQIANADLDPTLNLGAFYFGEGHYVSPHDAAAGNQHNNASYRSLNVTTFDGGGWNLNFVGTTQRTRPAILAWADADNRVEVGEVFVPGDGRFIIASLATDNGDGTWHYEYALYNMNSHRSGRALSIPVPPGVTVTDIEFKDIAYHSGEPYDGTDWPGARRAESVDWSTATFARDEFANALRFGTLYNFRFDADAPPHATQATLGLFRPGAPDDVGLHVAAPAPPCSAVAYCSAAESSLGTSASIGASGTTSLAANDLVLAASGAVPGQFGLFFYGPGAMQSPFADGSLCVDPGAVGLARLNPPLTLDGAGAATRPLDVTQPPADSGPAMISAGSTWYFQFWYRDPAGPGGTGSNLSNGLQVAFCP